MDTGVGFNFTVVVETEANSTLETKIMTASKQKQVNKK